MKKTLLFDTSNLIYRMFARAEKNNLDPLKSFKTEIESILNIYSAFDSIFAIDCKRGKSWRNSLLKEYKANRTAPTPELLYYRDKMIEYVKITYETYAFDGEEADDIIGTITNYIPYSLIVSNDADYQQLLENKKVEILCPNRSGTYDLVTEEDFKRKYNLNPIQLIDLKALKGDTSDNYKGCPGVGDKNAQSLIQKYNSIEGIYENIETLEGVKDKIKNSLKENKEYVHLCKTLATIKQNIPLDFIYKEKDNNLDIIENPLFNDLEHQTTESEKITSNLSGFSDIPF